jgi:biopolymer transport protein ExbD
MTGKPKETFPEEPKKKARIEIIPLIDVIFFLLATFVLFTLTLNKLVSIPVNLPVASTQPSRQEDKDMVILQISDPGTCYWNREPITMADIGPRLEQYKKTTDNPRVLISSDSHAKYGYAVQALDEVRLAGIQQVSVETQRRGTGR